MYNLNVLDEKTNYAHPNRSWESLKSLITYHPATGELRWVNARGKMPANSPAGCMVRKIPHVRIDGFLIRSANIAHFWMTGLWRNVMVVNGDQSDLRFENLRVYTPTTPDTVDHSNWLYAVKKQGQWTVMGNQIPVELLNKLQDVLIAKGV